MLSSRLFVDLIQRDVKYDGSYVPDTQVIGLNLSTQALGSMRFEEALKSRLILGLQIFIFFVG